MSTLFILNDPPYGTELVYNGLRLAGNILRQDPGHQLTVFLMGDAASAAKAGQSTPNGYYNVNKMLGNVLRGGGRVLVCGTCMDARGLTQDDLIPGALRSTLDELTQLTLAADKILTFLMAADGEVIYLDHNATTPIAAEVAEAMWPYLTSHFGNPSSDHPYGRAARAAVDLAREQVAALIGAHPDEITFTSGGTEANNLAIRGAAATLPAGRHHLVTSAVEHPATTEPVRLLSDAGWQVTTLPVDPLGRIDPTAAVGLGGVGLGTFILAQNEIGTLQPVAELADHLHARGALVHTDAAQAIGKIDVDVDDLGVDLLSIAGHKCYAPKGVGALYVRRGTPIAPVLVGAGQEHGLRPGTENVAGIVGLGQACALAREQLVTDAERIRGLRDLLLAELTRQIPSVVRLGDPDHMLPNTLTIAIPERIGTDILAACPHLAASTGSACHSGQVTPSATLLAIGATPDVAAGTIRLTLGRHTTTEQIQSAAHMVADAATS